MSSDEKALTLLPHQASLVDTVLNPASNRITLLRGEVGLGKSTALVAVASRFLQEKPTARVLILVPALLRGQLALRLQNAGTPVLLVDRYQFREMLDSTGKGEFWPRGVISVLSVDFAKQPDIQDSLANTHWDLVIADEVHSFKSSRKEILRRVGSSAERILLNSASPFDLEVDNIFEDGKPRIVEWMRDRIVGHDNSLQLLREVLKTNNGAQIPSISNRKYEQ